MKRKYLDDINAIDRPDLWKINKSKIEKIKMQQEVYGFDEREVYNLDITFYCWLYERLRMFNELSSVNLNYYKFDFKEKTYTQLELIDMIIERLEYLFSDKCDYYTMRAYQFDYIHEIEQIWAIILPYMWW